MTLTAFTSARRRAILPCLAIVIGSGLLCAIAVASEVNETDDFCEVAMAVAAYADEHGPEHVLFVVDIDNTLLAMDNELGSDQWFEWQKHLLDHEPKSEDLVGATFGELLQAQGMLFSLGHMHPPQRDLPLLVSRIQGRGVNTLVLTSRGPEFRVATERELRRNGYDFDATALAVRNLPRGAYLPYDLDDLAGDGLTPRDVAAFDMKGPQPISYESGIMMTAGQPKGAMLLATLHHAVPEIRAVVYADDHVRHVAYVFAAVAGRGIDIRAFHYTHEEPRVRAFQYGDKEEVGRRWRKLTRVLEEVFE